MNSGLLFLPCQSQRIGTYFIPALGKAPKWASFLENITEEMEEEQKDNVYDEFRFLTREDLEKINGLHLIGSKFLKSYMHGFIIKAKLHDRLKLESQPFDMEEYKQKKIEEKLDRELQDKIYIKNPKNSMVNKRFVERMKLKEIKTKNTKNTIITNDVFEDDRFKGLTRNKDFEVDEKNDEFLLRNASMKKTIKKHK